MKTFDNLIQEAWVWRVDQRRGPPRSGGSRAWGGDALIYKVPVKVTSFERWQRRYDHRYKQSKHISLTVSERVLREGLDRLDIQEEQRKRSRVRWFKCLTSMSNASLSPINCVTCRSRKSVADKIIEAESRLPFSASGSWYCSFWLAVILGHLERTEPCSQWHWFYCLHPVLLSGFGWRLQTDIVEVNNL